MHSNWWMVSLVLCGLVLCVVYARPSMVEGMTNSGSGNSGNSGKPRCPNLLIQKGAQYYLYNTNLAQVPGVNPVVFENLEQYTEFLEWQRGAGIRCPVLYVQNSYDAQGNRVYTVRPSVTEMEGGLPPVSLSSSSSSTSSSSSSSTTPFPPLLTSSPPVTPLVDATRSDAPYNQGSYPAYDQSSFYVGTTTPLDKMNDANSNMLYSDNPMDPNWGGAAYTQSLVNHGYYKDNEVSIKAP